MVERGYAYASDGSVFFRIAADPDYGRLSGIDLDQARRGERVASDEYEKEDLRDFVLWKGAKPGEPAWDSPWGPGRPGWHVECSAMSMKYLGESFDIHCGGVDNIFPHHENEIAQSQCCNGQLFAHHWYHSEHLLVDGKKMSKSLGNLYTLDDLTAKGFSPMALRYALLAAHPRKQLNFTLDGLHAAESALKTLREYRASLPATSTGAHDAFGHVLTVLNDDLNTPGALGAIFTVVNRKGGEADQASFDRVMFAPLMDLRGLIAVGPRIADHTINSIPMYPFPSYEDMRLKSQ